MDSREEMCQACGSSSGPLSKLSLGKDFFGRPYGPLSPLPDQNPKWYCASCYMHKNLHRDFRDIHAEFDKLRVGQSSELSPTDEFQRASLRLQEILTILSAPHQQSPFLEGPDVTRLLAQLNTFTVPV
jgi:hypothetical protein